MSEWYAAARTASGATDRRRHGALANWLAAELALRWRPVEGRPMLDRAEARRPHRRARSAAAREEAYLAPTFWTVAVYADLLVLDALWSQRATADEAQQALDLYRRASELGSEEQLRQVRDQVDFLLVMAGTEALRRVDFLRTLRDGLVALDAPPELRRHRATEGSERPRRARSPPDGIPRVRRAARRSGGDPAARGRGVCRPAGSACRHRRRRAPSAGAARRRCRPAAPRPRGSVHRC